MIPLLASQEDIDFTIQTSFGFPLLGCIAITSALSYFVYQRVIDTSFSNSALHEIGDRSFIFMSLIFGMFGSALLLKF